MYYKLFESFTRAQSPFHNRMIRANYALPEQVLTQIIDLCLSRLCPDGSLFYCPDGIEDGRVNLRTAIPIDKACCHRFTGPQDGMAAGFFNEGRTFYIRTVLEPPENVAPNESRGGEFEFYADDAVVDELFSVITTKFEGFFIIDGSKKHLEEILL